MHIQLYGKGGKKKRSAPDECPEWQEKEWGTNSVTPWGYRIRENVVGHRETLGERDRKEDRNYLGRGT